MIGGQGGAGRHQVADQVGAPQARRDFDRPGQHHHFGFDAILREESRQDVGIGGGDALSPERLRASVVEAIRDGDAQAAASIVQQLHRIEQGI